MVPRRLITLKEAAELAGVHYKTMRAWIAAGRVPAYRVGVRALRLDRAEVEAALLRPVTRVQPAVQRRITELRS